MSSASSHAAPSAPDLPAVRLAALRSELDRVDDTLHDALMRRAELVAQVAALRAKGPVPLRPGREAAIIRRLLARNRGALDPALLVRMWREMIAGFTAQQQPMRVVVDDPALLPIAARHFGLLSALDQVEEPLAAMRRLANGNATVAVLRWPGAWWTALLDRRATTLHVVARLPFWGTATTEALVLTAAAPDPSGDDRTLIAGELGPAELKRALAGIGAPRILGSSTAGPSVAEVDGFVTPADLAGAPGGLVVLGAYATQMGAP